MKQQRGIGLTGIGMLLYLAGMVFPGHPLLAQGDPSVTSDIVSDAEERYGPSAELYNGEKYPQAYRLAEGTPFFEFPGNPSAQVTIKGTVFNDLTIRYDMYNQVMVLETGDSARSPGSIILQDEWLEQVVIGDYLFKRFGGLNGQEQYAQILSEGTYQCVYLWEKRYLPDMHQGGKTYFFTEPSRQSYLIREGQMHFYKSNRSFLKGLALQEVDRVKRYLKDNRLKVKKASDQDMKRIMNFINQPANHGG